MSYIQNFRSIYVSLKMNFIFVTLVLRYPIVLHDWQNSKKEIKTYIVSGIITLTEALALLFNLSWYVNNIYNQINIGIKIN